VKAIVEELYVNKMFTPKNEKDALFWYVFGKYYLITMLIGIPFALISAIYLVVSLDVSASEVGNGIGVGIGQLLLGLYIAKKQLKTLGNDA
jgi:hypothetical protein